MEIQIGVVTRYYDTLGVAVIDVMNQTLRQGDTVRISNRFGEFTQDVGMLRIGHRSVAEVGAGDTCGMAVVQPVKTGDILYLLTNV